MKKRLNLKIVILSLVLGAISLIALNVFGAIVQPDDIGGGSVWLAGGTCSRCGRECSFNPIISPTCEKSGTTKYKCTTCGEFTASVPATGHKYDSGVVTKTATCSETGMRTYTCTACGGTKGTVISKNPNNHIPQVTQAAITATCVKAGYQEEKKCSLCGLVTQEYKNIGKNPDNHANPKSVKYYTNINVSYHSVKRYYTCCGAFVLDTTSGQVVEETQAHQWDENQGIVIKAATCTEKGILQVPCVSGKGTSYACGATKNVDIAALGHSYTVKDTSSAYLKTKATCTQAAVYYYRCSRCALKGTTTYTNGNPIAHTYTAKDTSSTYLKSSATCTQAAVYYYKCSGCTAKGTTTYTSGNPIAHTFTSKTTTEKYLKSAATCTSSALYYFSCKVCGEIGTTMYESGDKLPHDYAVVSKDEAVCENGGKIVYKCKNCPDTYEQTIPATGHTLTVVAAKAATCTETGLTEGKMCSVCHEILEPQQEIAKDPNNHSGKRTDKYNIPSNTQHQRIGYYECCQAVYKTWEPADHYWENETITQNPTCTTEGKETVICVYCKLTKENTLPKSAHKEEVVPGKAATCTEVGLTEGKKCIDCKEVIVVQEEIPVIPHTEEVVPGKAATCETPGVTDGKICSVCEAVLVAQEEIPVIPHTEEVVPGKVATCKEAGLTEGKVCSVCGEEIVAQEEIPVIPHTEEVVPGKAATCTEVGLTEGKVCSVCSEEIVAQEEIPATGHVEEVVPGKAATCTETGLTEGKACSECDEVLVAQEEIPALGHNFGEWVIEKEATYEEEGLKYRVCTNCNEERQEEKIPKLPKEEVTITTTHTVKEIENNKYIEISETNQLQNFLKNITSNSEVIVKDKDGNVLNSNSKIGTGAKVITKEDGKEQFTVILKGDINSDGEVDFKDIIRANAVRIISGENTISKAQLFAADLNNTNKIEFRDIITLNAIRINAGK